jgi:hypothetical protein
VLNVATASSTARSVSDEAGQGLGPISRPGTG